MEAPAAPVAVSTVAAPPGPPAPPPPLRWGIIGCGAVCETKSGPALYTAAGSRLAAVMRRDAAKAQDFAARHGAAQRRALGDGGAAGSDGDGRVAAYGSAAELLADPRVDAVYVATPPSTHLEHVLAALAAGKKVVLVEKPAALDAAQCDELAAAAAAAGARLYVAYYRRFYPKWQAAKRLLDAGVVGRPLGARILMCNPGAAASGWRVDPAVGGGGHFVDVGSHRLDMACYLLGAPAPAATAVGGGAGGVAAAGFAANELGRHAAENDVVGAVRLASGAVMSAAFHFATGPRRDVFEVYGDGGVMTFDPFDGESFSVAAAPGFEPVVHGPFPTPSPVHLPFVQAAVWHAAGLDVAEAAAAAEASGMGRIDPRLLKMHVDGTEGAMATRIIDAFLAERRVAVAAAAAAAAAEFGVPTAAAGRGGAS